MPSNSNLRRDLTALRNNCNALLSLVAYDPALGPSNATSERPLTTAEQAAVVANATQFAANVTACSAAVAALAE